MHPDDRLFEDQCVKRRVARSSTHRAPLRCRPASMRDNCLIRHFRDGCVRKNQGSSPTATMCSTLSIEARRRSTDGMPSVDLLMAMSADTSAAGFPVSRAAPASASGSRAREKTAVTARQIEPTPSRSRPIGTSRILDQALHPLVARSADSRPRYPQLPKSVAVASRDTSSPASMPDCRCMRPRAEPRPSHGLRSQPQGTPLLAPRAYGCPRPLAS